MRYLFLVGFVLLLVSCNGNAEKESYVDSNTIKSVHRDGYVGDGQCIACHKDTVELWKGSDHDLAMQIANKSTVLGDFNNISLTLDGVGYFFTKEENEFIVKVKEIDGSQVTYKISYVFGVTPLQQYISDFEKGKKQVLRVTWDVIDKKWYHQYPGDEVSPHDWMHWTKSSQNWNTMCAECHSTNLQKNYAVEEDAFNTTYSYINVNCESCHGPAEGHVNWANSKQSATDSTAYILPGNSQFAQMNMCASCHARRAKLTANMVPGENFEDQYLLENLSGEFYHGDGQIDGEDYVYGSFVQSKMYHNNVTCTDCHDPHTLKLKEVGNNLCMQCHVPEYNTPKHSFHPIGSDGAQCINCHMTGVTYMGNDYRRDHSFRVPRPDQSVVYGTPNACNTCHQDKSSQWAADKVVEWYGSERQDHFSDALLLSSQPTISKKERKALDVFINDLNFPAIARATVIDNLQITETEQYSAILKGLKDTSPRVRFAALQKFRGLSLDDRSSIALQHINDTTRLVRIGTAQLLAGVDLNTFDTGAQAGLKKSRAELEEMLNSSADFSVGRMQLADYFYQSNDIENAIKHYKVALEKDSLLMPVYSNLATCYSIQGNSNEALKVLNLAISKQPEMGRHYYLRALLYFELQQGALAVKDFEQAIKLDPYDTRAMYNLATYYYQNKTYNSAEKIINKALAIEEHNPDFKYLLALIYKEQGKEMAYQMIMQTLNPQKPNQ